MLAQFFHSLAEALEVDNLAFAQELQHVVDVRIVADPQQVVIGYAGLLLCCAFVRTTLFMCPLSSICSRNVACV